MSQSIQVLIVDDSALVRSMLRDIISADPEMEVVGMAANGVEAIRAVSEMKPDVVTMDIHMPDMDGLAALEYIMSKHPMPVVMLSALAKKGANATIRALELGAVDFITKPSHFPSAVKEIREEVILKVKTAAQVRRSILRSPDRRKERRKLTVRKKTEPEEKLVVIGASAGGPKALAEIMPLFPADIPAAMIIVQHMPSVFTGSFAERLNNSCDLEVKEAEENDNLVPGRVLVAPGGGDMIVDTDSEGSFIVHLMSSQNKVGASPRIDSTMITAADFYGKDSMGVILTGMGSDGALGIEKIKKGKGNTVAQDEETCLVYGMPRVAVEGGYVDWVVPLDKIPEKVLELL